MYLIAIAWMFAGPAYYLAKSKGRSGPLYAFVTCVLSLPCAYLGLLGFILPATVLGVLHLMPHRPGAPGKAYLKITFPCPECRKELSFPRHRENTAELCPQCGELIRIPLDKFSEKPNKSKIRPTMTTGEVCFDCFGRPDPAHILAAILTAKGVPAQVHSNAAAGMAPIFGHIEGYRVVINVEDWDSAVAIEGECQKEELAP